MSIDEIAASTNIIIDFPHNPSAWLSRGQTLKKLGYPDLAAGDIHKSMLLADAVVDTQTTNIIRKDSRIEFGFCLWFFNMNLWNTQTWEETHQFIRDEATKILIEAYQLLFSCFHDLGAAFDKVCLSYQHIHRNFGYPQEVMDRLGMILGVTIIALQDHYYNTVRFLHDHPGKILQQGSVVVRSWPWLTTSQLTRSKGLMGLINLEFRERCGNLRVAASRVKEVCEDGPNVLGVFATENIKAGCTVLMDRTILAACSHYGDTICAHCFNNITGQDESGSGSDDANCSDSPCLSNCCDKCSTNYCSLLCKEEARASYHQVLCGKDFSWVYDQDQGDADLQAGLLLRTLAVCVQAGIHPLDHHLLARLTASDDRAGREERWSFAGDVTVPMQILEQLGVDVFADQRFDTWVIRTIWSRLMINKFGYELDDGARNIVSVKPLTSFFNHSCEPQLVYDDAARESTIRIVAGQDIKKGEELYLSYIGPCEGWPLEVRRDKLSSWFGGDCQCTRCMREEKEPVVEEEEEDDGEEMTMEDT